MNKIIILGAILWVSSTFAATPFDGITGKSLGSGVDSCSATKILDKAIGEAGVNPLDTTTSAVWNCKCVNGSGACEGLGMLRTRYELNGCKAGEEMTCYSDSTSKSSALCLSYARSVKVKQHYFQIGDRIDVRPRFSAIYVVRNTGSGQQADKSWKMDGDGCEPVSATFDNSIVSPEECKKYISAYMTGGLIYRQEVNDKIRFCDGASHAGQLFGLSKLHDCTEAYPKLAEPKTYEKIAPPVIDEVKKTNTAQ